MNPLEASQLLTDEYSAKILLATYKRKISAQEISSLYGIPIAACYRKIRSLEEAGLIECVERILTQAVRGRVVGMRDVDEAALGADSGGRFDVADAEGQPLGEEQADDLTGTGAQLLADDDPAR